MGKSLRRSGAVLVIVDHPHVRGEKRRFVSRLHNPRGSSPRAWGKDYRQVYVRARERIIPTCVGKSEQAPTPPGQGTDHPHVRGEKVSWGGKFLFRIGSSPRAWGKGVSCADPAGFTRIIPTCVGKRRFVPQHAHGVADHPHVRGEKEAGGLLNGVGDGSSPRAWGKASELRET